MLPNGVCSPLLSRIHPEGRRQVEDQSPFRHLAQCMQDIVGDGGVLKEVIHAGDGPLIPKDATVSINYSGFLEYSGRPFDTTIHLRFPRMMKLGKDVTLCGLELGLLTMRKGEFSRFLLRPSYAYGAMGCPPFIPPESTVLYEVQVMDFLDTAEYDEFLALTPEEQNSAPLSTLLNIAVIEKTLGNRLFNQSRYKCARDRYRQAINFLQNRDPADEEEKQSLEKAMLPFLLNLSLTYLRLERPQKALQYGERALKISPDHTKALFRCGQACLEMLDCEKALNYLTMAQARKPFDPDINNTLRKLAACLDTEKEMCSKMCSGFKSQK